MARMGDRDRHDVRAVAWEVGSNSTGAGRRENLAAGPLKTISMKGMTERE